MKKSILFLAGRLWAHFQPRRRLQFLLLICLMLFSAIAEVVTLGAVLPFISILIAPDKIFNNFGVSVIANDWGITHANDLILPLTILFVFSALFAGILRMILIWVSSRLAYAGGADISTEVYRRTLYQPYSAHLARNTSEVISGITNKVNAVVFELLMPLSILASSMVLMLFIIFTLIIVNPLVALVVTGGFGTCYLFITYLSRARVRRNSQRIAKEQTLVVKALQEGLGGIRDVLINGTQATYCKIYRDADLSLRRAQASNSFIASGPRYVMESIGMILIATLAYSLSLQPGGVATALPVLGALALGAQRLLPALQQSYNSWISVAGCEASIEDILELLEQPLPEGAFKPLPEPLLFQSSIQFDCVSFCYTKNGPLVLKELDLLIHKGDRVGFVGSTGGGKSTTLDLLMGLLTPTEGRLLVDDQHLFGSKIQAWQQCIAHVPQSIYLADTTIAENIAFGVPRHMVDFQLVMSAARQAHISDYIEKLPEKYNSFVGERGIRLSGGQRQRIGIARALYRQSKVLVFDEATSALDSSTEQSVMAAIEELNRDLTVLIIAHRLTTVKSCDFIIELEKGRIISQGTYGQLLLSSSSFRRLANVAA